MFLVTISFISCDRRGADLTSNPIDSNIKVEFREQLSATSRQSYLFCATERAYPCINFGILTDEKLNKNKLDVTFVKVIESGICLTALGPG
ncbi:hypothetical protein GCM10027516_14810 [Niabella aquatica]